ATPMGPFFLLDLLGLDTAGHVARYLHDVYGDRVPLHQGMLARIERGELGAKRRRGFYDHAQSPPRATDPGGARTGAAAPVEEVVDRFQLKALVEACLVLEEGIASAKDIDLGMMAGAGIAPAPLQRADRVGLDTVLAQLERARERWGDHYAPPG